MDVLTGGALVGKKSRFAAQALIGLVAVVIYWAGLHGPFVLDDITNIPQTDIAGLSLDELGRVMAGGFSGPLKRPVSVLSFALNHYLGGHEPFGFKLVNLALHLVIGGLLLVLGRRVLGLLGAGEKAAWNLAAVAATLWLLHPLNVSAVLYAVQRMAQLSTLFMVLGMLCYVEGRERQVRGEKRAYPWMLTALFICTPLAALSKETGLLLPPFLFLLEVILFRFAVRGGQARWPLVSLVLVTCVAPVLMAMLYHGVNWDRLIQGYSVRPYTLEDRLLTQPHVLVYYLRQIFAPRLSWMGLYLDDFPITHAWDTATALSVGVLAGLLLVGLLAYRKAPLLSLGIGWFFLAHALESTVFPLEMVFEHRNYLAMWGLFLPLVWYAHKGISGWKWGTSAGFVLASLAMTILAFQTYLRVLGFVDFPTFIVTHHQNHPNSLRALTYMGILHSVEGNVEKAREYYALATERAPYEPGIVLLNLSTYCQGTLPPPEMLALAEKSLREGLLTFTARNKLSELATLSVTRACPNIRGDTMLGWVEVALKNPGARNMHRADQVNYAKGLLLLEKKGLAESEVILRGVLLSRADYPYCHRLGPLFTIARSRFESGDRKAAGEIFGFLRQMNAHRCARHEIMGMRRPPT